MQSELKSTKHELNLAKNKVTALENEAAFKDEQHGKGVEAISKMNRDLRTVRDENMLLKQSIKSLNAQSESILAGCLKRLQ